MIFHMIQPCRGHQAQQELDAAERNHRSAEEKAKQAGERWRNDELQKLEQLRLQASWLKDFQEVEPTQAQFQRVSTCLVQILFVVL